MTVTVGPAQAGTESDAQAGTGFRETAGSARARPGRAGGRGRGVLGPRLGSDRDRQ